MHTLDLPQTVPFTVITFRFESTAGTIESRLGPVFRGRMPHKLCPRTVSQVCTFPRSNLTLASHVIQPTSIVLCVLT